MPENVRRGRLVFLFWSGDAKYNTAFSLTPTTQVFIVKAGAVMLSTG